MRYEDPKREAAAYVQAAIRSITLGIPAEHAPHDGGWDVRGYDKSRLPAGAASAIGALCCALDELLPGGEP